MFGRLFAVASLAALAVASNSHLVARGQCDTGNINCCTGTFQVSDFSNALKQFGMANVLAGASGLGGSGCSPWSGVGVGNNGGECAQEPLCCDNNVFGGLIGVGCSPINVGL